MTKIPRNASTVALVAAIEANELERFARFSRLPGGEFHRGSRLLRHALSALQRRPQHIPASR